jgi:Mg-chelatase subunit ChlD
MNNQPPHPSPEEQECRLTALLLGELDTKESEALQRAMEQDPELARLHDRLRQTIGLVRETVGQPFDSTQHQAGGLRMSDERRRDLLKRFGYVVPTPIATARRELPWFIPMSVAAALIALIGFAALLLPLREDPSMALEMHRSERSAGNLHAALDPANSDPGVAFFERESVPAQDRSVAEAHGLELRAKGRPVQEFRFEERESRLARSAAEPAGRVAEQGPTADGEDSSRRRELAAGELAAITGFSRGIAEGGGAIGGAGGGEGVDNDAFPRDDRTAVDRLMRNRYALAPSSAGLAEKLTEAPDEPSGLPVLGDEALVGRLFKPETPAIRRGESRELFLGLQGGTAPSLDDISERGPSAGSFFHSYGTYQTRQESDDQHVVPTEALTPVNPFSTFSMNVSDVSFKLVAAHLENGALPIPSTIRTEEFINAFDYRDPEPGPGTPLGFVSETALHPFAHNRELIRFAVKTASQGREPGRALNLVLLLDNSGSMERSDRVEIIREALGVLANQLNDRDRISVVAFARTARLWIDGLPGDRASELLDRVGNLTPQGGTNLETAMRLGYETARRWYLVDGVNRLIVLTDGAANLGDVEPDSLRQVVETHRQQGIALDCFGIGWDGYNDDLLEVLVRHGDGRYGFVNSPAEAADGFAAQMAGSLRVAAADVKVQIKFNPDRVITHRAMGYEKHQLAKEQFRDNSVDAAEIGAAEAGNAIYAVQLDPDGRGPIGQARVRFKVPATGEYQELEWVVPYRGRSPALAATTPSMRLAGVAALTAEWLAESPFAADITGTELLALLRGVPESYGPDVRPAQLERMIRQAQVLGKQ